MPETPPESPAAEQSIRQVLAGLLARCPYCDYELTGLESNVCPECGNHISATDLELDARRRVFLELTRWRVPIWNSGLALAVSFFLWPGGMAILFVHALAIGAAWILPQHHTGKLVRKVKRRVWVSCAWILLMPWLLIGALWLTIDWLYWNTYYFDSTGGPEDLIEYVHPLMGIGVLCVLCALGVVIWRFRLRRLSRAAGVEFGPSGYAFPWRSIATRIALFPVVIVLILATLLVFANWLLDSLGM